MAKKLICTGNYLNTSGAPMNALLVASEAEKLGWDAEAWFLCPTGTIPSSDVPIRVFSAQKPRGILAWLKVLAAYSFALATAKADRIISFYPLTNVIGALAGFIGGAYFVASQQNPSHAQNTVTKLLDKALGCTSLYKSNVTVSRAVAASFKAYPQAYRKRLKVVYNAVPPTSRLDDTPAQARKALGLPVKGYIIGSLGRLEAQKNLSFLLKAFALVPNAMLAIAGEGSERDALTKLADELKITDRIIWTGLLQGMDVVRFYRAIDVFAVPSVYEGFGRTLIEAMAEKTPIVANQLDVLVEVSGGDAAIHLPLSEDAWASTFISLQNNPELGLTLGKQGLLRQEIFSVEEMTRGYIG